MTNSDNTVKPCPFCGGSNIAIRYEGQPATYFAYQCGDCGGTTGAVLVGGTPSGSVITFDNPEAIAAWNTRADSPKEKL